MALQRLLVQHPDGGLRAAVGVAGDDGVVTTYTARDKSRAVMYDRLANGNAKPKGVIEGPHSEMMGTQAPFAVYAPKQLMIIGMYGPGELGTEDSYFGDFIEDDSVESPINAATQEMLKDKIDVVLKTLTYREREIIKLRYGLGDGYTYTLEEVGRIFKVTRERVRQIEAKAVRKLQHPVRSKQLKGFLDTLAAATAPAK